MCELVDYCQLVLVDQFQCAQQFLGRQRFGVVFWFRVFLCESKFISVCTPNHYLHFLLLLRPPSLRALYGAAGPHTLLGHGELFHAVYRNIQIGYNLIWILDTNAVERVSES